MQKLLLGAAILSVMSLATAATTTTTGSGVLVVSHSSQYNGETVKMKMIECDEPFASSANVASLPPPTPPDEHVRC